MHSQGWGKVLLERGQLLLELNPVNRQWGGLIKFLFSLHLIILHFLFMYSSMCFSVCSTVPPQPIHFMSNKVDNKVFFWFWLIILSPVLSLTSAHVSHSFCLGKAFCSLLSAKVYIQFRFLLLNYLSVQQFGFSLKKGWCHHSLASCVLKILCRWSSVYLLIKAILRICFWHVLMLSITNRFCTYPSNKQIKYQGVE